MNKERRKRIDALVEQLKEISSAFAELADEENEAVDNMPEGLQESERGQTMYDNIDQLNNIESEIDSIAEDIDFE